MPDHFIAVVIQSDATQLADDAGERLRAQWDDYEPQDGDLEVVTIEAVAPMAQDCLETTARVPDAVFIEIGKLHGIAYSPGARATGTVTFTLTDADPHEIPAGTEIDIDGYAFYVDTTTPTAALEIAGVPVTAGIAGAEANALTGALVREVSGLSFVLDTELDAPTANGVDAEDDASFRDKVSRELELKGDTLVTARDYEIKALSHQEVARAVAIPDAATKTMTVYLVGPAGGVVATAVKDAISAEYEALRLANWTVTLGDPTVTPVDVTYSVHFYPGYDTVDGVARTDAALASVLSPDGWGQEKNAETSVSSLTWVNDPVVRANKLIDVLGDVPGVDYADSVAIAGADVDGNLTLPGTVALPTVGTLSGTAV